MSAPSLTQERYCAVQIAFLEDEELLAVGEAVARRLNPRYHEDRRVGRAASLPDLFSRKDGRYRLREVKYRLDDKTVRKAVAQLTAGAAFCSEEIDRLEIAIPLGPRKLKTIEADFLGTPLPDGRHQLALDGVGVQIGKVAVTVILL